MLPRYRSLKAGAIADVGRAIAMAAGGVLAFAPVEYALSLWAYAGTLGIASKLRLAALVATLSAILFLVLAIALSAVLLLRRLVGRRFDADVALAPSLFDPSPLARGIRAGVPRVWATVVTAAALAVPLQLYVAYAFGRYKEPQLAGALVAAVAVGFAIVAVPVYRVITAAATVGAQALAPVLRIANPLGRWRAAGIALAALVGGALAAIWYTLPQSRSVLPVRLVISALVIALGAGMGAHIAGRARSGFVEVAVVGVVDAMIWFSSLAIWLRVLLIVAVNLGTIKAIVMIEPRLRGHRKRNAAVFGLASFALSVVTLLRWGADLETKYAAITSSPALDDLIKLVRVANDIDFDGFGSLLGENDCNPLDGSIHPGARDKPDDNIDQNCDGHDFSLKGPPLPTGPTLPVPDNFKKQWNVLLITIDALRYDHTSFGGYKTSTKRRDTTPNLDKLVKRSTSFSFAQAPSAGTMASIPAILTSKFFHSGIALDENQPRGTPPKIKPENVLLPEIMKRGGYVTGVVGSHEWWNDWGLDQGVDDYDNSIGKVADPRRVAADKVTDHILAWVSRQQGRKWFMWAHYIDPHGYYIAHPDVVDYGSSDADLYDAEIQWTDQQVGRLLDELVRLPSNENTIIVITADHGESMAEHSVPLGTHGTALYRELLHVPLVFYIPDNQPHVVGGAVTNLDIVPTLAELCGIDVHDLSFEGKSLVPQLFYAKADPHRIVFAETNAPSPQRTAISEAYKLIYYLHANVSEFYDLKADPLEQHNLAPASPDAMGKMREALDAWLERVVYARDKQFNQAAERIADVLLSARPTPAVATSQQTLDGGKLEILGIELAKDQHLTPGAKVDVHVYFAVRDRSQLSYRFLLAGWPVDPATWKPTDLTPATLVRSTMRATAEGFFPTDRWRAGEYIRERFTLQIPLDWKAPAMAVGLVASDASGAKADATGPAPQNDSSLAVLGVLPMENPPESPGSSAPPHP